MKAEEVLVVVVLYSNQAEPCLALRSLMAHPEAQRMAWVIWDNHPLPDMKTKLQHGLAHEESFRFERWHYEAHAENPGLSCAYRAASKWAMEWGCSWMLLADQDTHFPADWWDGYSQGVDHSALGLMVPQLYSSGMCISPAVHRFGISRPNPRPWVGEIDLYRYMPINSGMMIRISDYIRCGGHLAEVRLDFSDTAFVYRLRSAAVRAAVVPVVCSHGLSGLEPGSYEVRLLRFRHFCRDARAWAKTEGPAAYITIVVIARALRLSMRYRRFGFMRVLLQQFFLGRPI
ncbi:MAG: hypothetical protein ACKOA7_04100 [Bacteroidota bacterium]